MATHRHPKDKIRKGRKSKARNKPFDLDRCPKPPGWFDFAYRPQGSDRKFVGSIRKATPGEQP